MEGRKKKNTRVEGNVDSSLTRSSLYILRRVHSAQIRTVFLNMWNVDIYKIKDETQKITGRYFVGGTISIWQVAARNEICGQTAI